MWCAVACVVIADVFIADATLFMYVRCRMSDDGCRMQEVECNMSDVGCNMYDVRRRM